MVPDQPVWELSGWWRRAWAQTIDDFVVAVPATLLYLVIDGTAGDVVVYAVWLAIGAVYYPWIMLRTNGQTFGKLATGIRVVREDGSELDRNFILTREVVAKQLLFGIFGQFLFLLPTIINYLLPIPDKSNQAIHDKMVRSRVVRANPLAGEVAQPTPTFGGPVAEAPAWPTEEPKPPSGPPKPPDPPGGSIPYTPPPGFENPVPDDDN